MPCYPVLYGTKQTSPDLTHYPNLDMITSKMLQVKK